MAKSGHKDSVSSDPVCSDRMALYNKRPYPRSHDAHGFQDTRRMRVKFQLAVSLDRTFASVAKGDVPIRERWS